MLAYHQQDLGRIDRLCRRNLPIKYLFIKKTSSKTSPSSSVISMNRVWGISIPFTKNVSVAKIPFKVPLPNSTSISESPCA